MEAPKCPHCKKREWRHICGDLVVNATPSQVVNAQLVVNARSKDRHKKVRQILKVSKFQLLWINKNQF